MKKKTKGKFDILKIKEQMLINKQIPPGKTIDIDKLLKKSK